MPPSFLFFQILSLFWSLVGPSLNAESRSVSLSNGLPISTQHTHEAHNQASCQIIKTKRKVRGQVTSPLPWKSFSCCGLPSACPTEPSSPRGPPRRSQCRCGLRCRALWEFSILLYSLAGSSSDHHPANDTGLGWASFPAGHHGWWRQCPGLLGSWLPFCSSQGWRRGSGLQMALRPEPQAPATACTSCLCPGLFLPASRSPVPLPFPLGGSQLFQKPLQGICLLP